jgi:hypothetical protein
MLRRRSATTTTIFEKLSNRRDLASRVFKETAKGHRTEKNPERNEQTVMLILDSRVIEASEALTLIF